MTLMPFVSARGLDPAPGFPFGARMVPAFPMSADPQPRPALDGPIAADPDVVGRGRDPDHLDALWRRSALDHQDLRPRWARGDRDRRRGRLRGWRLVVADQE